MAPGAGGPGGELAEAVAREIRGLRARRDWTQAELARRAGVGENLIGDLEQGRANPRLGTLVKVAAALGVSVGELLGH